MESLKQKEALRIVFSDRRYIVLAIAISIGMSIALLAISEFIFIQPYLAFYLPDYAIPRFTLIIIISVLSGLVISMSLYRLKMGHMSRARGGTNFIGSFIGTAAGVCGCSQLGFTIISTFGTAGGIATAFLTNYEIPLRLIAIGILLYTYFITVKGITSSCRI